ncbi:MAG TPA: GMC family oxidoreductase [Fimbriimonadaceae bacterium]|nr:GMC family oxidoreductase [Fimbriimonadaceae bacterium]
MADFDVLVIGSGAGGGLAAWNFAERGKRVLIVDRGRSYPTGWTGRDHLRNHRFSRYGHNTGPGLEGNPRVFVSPDGRAGVYRPNDGAYQNNAMAIGGGTRVYGAQAWRFHPLDFRMASTYGVPSGSSLADWPIHYEELAPYYEAVEWELGVSGGGPASTMPPRRDYPMPPLPESGRTGRLRNAAERLGWACQRPPMLMNSEPYGGRGACSGCQHCVGFGCPTDAKAGTQNTVLPKVLGRSGCELWAETRVTRLLTDGAGQVTGASLIREGVAIEVTADVIVVAAGAIETPRLLLLTHTAREPNGIGNTHDWVGRNLQGHYYPGAVALFEEVVNDLLGPGPSLATLQFSHGNSGIIGGGMLCDDFIPLPVWFAREARPSNVPAFGAEFKEWVRHNYRRCFHIFGPTQDIPNPDCRVTLDPEVVDDVGVPVARLSGTTHPETVKTALFMRDRAAEWLREAGAREVWTKPVGLGMSAGQHQAGTCRMAARPSDGVVDSQGRVFGHDNLLVCDASVHVTNGGFNPVLTVMATALRSATLFG